jgi:hypothetical protein
MRLRLKRCLPVTDDIATGACDQQHGVACSDSGDDVWCAVLVEHKPVQARAAVLRQRVDVPPDLAGIPFLLQTMFVRRGLGQQLGGQRRHHIAHLNLSVDESETRGARAISERRVRNNFDAGCMQRGARTAKSTRRCRW